MARWEDKENLTYQRLIGGRYGVSLGEGFTQTWSAEYHTQMQAYRDLPSQTEVCLKVQMP